MDFGLFITIGTPIQLVCYFFIILGSLLICASILKYEYLQTTQNVYVFSLAVADVLQFTIRLSDLVSFILQVVIKWTVYQHLLTIAVLICMKVVIWTAVCIAIDRYIVICHPSLGRRVSTYSRAVNINVTLWAMSLICTLYEVMYALIYGIEERLFDQYVLIETTNLEIILKVVIPVCIILPAYVCMVLSILKSSKVRASCSTSEQPLSEKSFKKAAVIALQFVICRAPTDVKLNIVKMVNPDNEYVLTTIVICIIVGFKFLGIVLLPVLYALVSNNLRKAFKDIGCICIGYIRRLLCCGKAAANVGKGLDFN